MARSTSTTSLGVCVLEPAEVDLDVFSLWLKGHSVEEANAERVKHIADPVTREFHDYPTLLHSETRDQYRTFQLLEPYLQLPQTLMNQHLFQLPVATQLVLIQRYYTFDKEVVREFLGKKLSTKNRKDLDDVSEKTGISLKSCRRQFDNIKQVLRVVDDYEGSLVKNIEEQFILPEDLARSYASVVFMSHNRFETHKRKLTNLTFTDFTFCASAMIDHWTAGSAWSRAVDDDLELDRDFLQELHDLKLNVIDSVWIDRQQKLVVKDLRRQKYPTAKLKTVEVNFKALSKSMTILGASLIHSKDLKDFFIDLIEKVIDPCKQLRWTGEDMEMVLTSVGRTFEECESGHFRLTSRSKDKKPWSVVYIRYLDTLRNCILIIYDNC